MGKHWRIYVEDEYQSLLKALEAGGIPQPLTPEMIAKLLGREVEPFLLQITRRVQHVNPNFDLEGLLELVFKAIPGVHNVTRKRGRADRGADLIVEFEGGLPHPAFQTQHKCVVQAKSYSGDHRDTRAVEDIRRAFIAYPDADMGLIVSTAESST
jgi:hypothetical protein